MKKTVSSAALFFAPTLVVLAALAGCSSSPKPKTYTTREKAELYINAARGALDEKDPTGALGYLVQAEKLEDDIPDLHYVRGLAFHAKHDLKSAVAAMRRAVELNPKFSDASTTLGRMLLDGGALDEAEKYFKQAAEDPLFREVYKAQTGLGIVYYRKDEFKKAEEQFDSAIISNPAVACIAYYYRGHLRLRESKYESAIRDYEKATQKFCGGFADAQLALGMAYERSQKYDQARKAFLAVKQRYPESKAAEQAMDHLKYIP